MSESLFAFFFLLLLHVDFFKYFPAFPLLFFKHTFKKKLAETVVQWKNLLYMTTDVHSQTQSMTAKIPHPRRKTSWLHRGGFILYDHKKQFYQETGVLLLAIPKRVMWFRKMQIKMVINCYSILTKMAKMKKIDIIKCWQGPPATGTFLPYDSNENWCNYWWN